MKILTKFGMGQSRSNSQKPQSIKKNFVVNCANSSLHFVVMVRVLFKYNIFVLLIVVWFDNHHSVNERSSVNSFICKNFFSFASCISYITEVKVEDRTYLNDGQEVSESR